MALLRQSSLKQNVLERKDSLKDSAGFDPNRRRSSIEQLNKQASPFGQMLENVMKFSKSRSLWDDEMQRDLPKKWEKHGDMVVFSHNSFTHNNWRLLGREVWQVIAESLKVNRLGRKRVIDSSRTPHVDILYGSDGWVEHLDERGLRFKYDASKRVFNNMKTKEMQRIAQWDCRGETIVDMYASLGYYAFTYAIACHAKEVYAIEWDEDMCEALLLTSQLNGLEATVKIIQGDARKATPQSVADRVYLGLIPSCRAHWLAACKALKAEGGLLHIHDIIELGAPKKLQRKESILKKLPQLSSVDEEMASKENQPTAIASSPTAADREKPSSTTSTAEVSSDASGEQQTSEDSVRTRRKFSRSASIVEEMENRVLPDVKILPDLESGHWTKLSPSHKDFALDCASSCIRFLNNIHFSDTMYVVTILNVTSYGSSVPKSDHVVLDLLCSQVDAPIEKLAAKFTNTNKND